MGTLLRFNHHLEATFQEWSHRAACRGSTVNFHPSREDDSHPALALCARCEVRAECLDYAIAKPERWGIWGGTTEGRRKRLRKAS